VLRCFATADAICKNVVCIESVNLKPGSLRTFLLTKVTSTCRQNEQLKHTMGSIQQGFTGFQYVPGLTGPWIVS
jgi:hypothetical protein